VILPNNMESRTRTAGRITPVISRAQSSQGPSDLMGNETLPDVTGDPKTKIVESIGRQLSCSQRRPEQCRLIEPGAAAREAVSTCRRRIGLTV
jgi:hypothetical protein